jgi:centriolar protein POC1
MTCELIGLLDMKFVLFRECDDKGPVYSVDFHPSGHVLLSASADETVRLWAVSVFVLTFTLIIRKGNVTTTLKAHGSRVRSAKFSNSGEILASCSDDKSIKVGFVFLNCV